jgi:predicted O-methyltransferase YrrM
VHSCDQAAGECPKLSEEARKKIQAVIDEVEKLCREERIPMIGPRKAKRLAELVRTKKPKLAVECGTAIGYSALWIGRELKAAGKGGKLITIEIDAERAERARGFISKAGLDDVVEVRVGDARKVVKKIEGPVEFLFLDCGFGNYLACFRGIERSLADGALIVADNAGIGAEAMADYLKLMRSQHKSRTEWFELNLPWAKRDAMEMTVYRRK